MNDVHIKIYDQVNNRIKNQLSEQVWFRVYSQVNNPLQERVRIQVWHRTDDLVWIRAYDHIENNTPIG